MTNTVHLEGTSIEIGAGFYDQVVRGHLATVLDSMRKTMPTENLAPEVFDFLLGFTAAQFGWIQASIGHEAVLHLVDTLRGYSEKMQAEDQAPHSGGVH